MTKRTDLLLSNGLYKAMTDLQAEMTSFKNAQYTSGRTNIIGYVTESASVWDATGTVGSDSDGSLTRTSTYSMTFTGDGSQAPVMANLSFLFYVNGTDVAHQLTPVDNFFSDGSGRTANITYGAITETQTTYTQTVTLLTQMAITYFIKVYTVGSSGGTVSAARTS